MGIFNLTQGQSYDNTFKPGYYPKAPVSVGRASDNPSVDITQFRDPVALNKAWKSGQISSNQYKQGLRQLYPSKGGSGKPTFGDVLGGVGSALGTTATDLARFIPKSVAGLEATAQQRITGKPTSRVASGPIGRFLLGSTPIQSAQERGAGAAAAHPGGFHIKGTPITLSPATTAGAETGLGFLSDVSGVLPIKAPINAAFDTKAGLTTLQNARVKALSDAISRAKNVKDIVPNAPKSAIDSLTPTVSAETATAKSAKLASVETPAVGKNVGKPNVPPTRSPAELQAKNAEIQADVARLKMSTAVDEALQKHPGGTNLTDAQGAKVVANRHSHIQSIVDGFNKKYGTNFKDIQDAERRISDGAMNGEHLSTNLLYNYAQGTPLSERFVASKSNVPEVPKGEVYFRGEGKNAQVAAQKTLKGNQFGDGVYMTPNKEWAAKYGDVGQYRVKPGTKFYSAVREVSHEGVGTLYDKKTGVPIEFGHLPGIGKYLDKYGSGEENQALQEWARANGYHGLKIHDESKGGKLNEVVVFDKSRIEPVTQPAKVPKPPTPPEPVMPPDIQRISDRIDSGELVGRSAYAKVAQWEKDKLLGRLTQPTQGAKAAIPAPVGKNVGGVKQTPETIKNSPTVQASTPLSPTELQKAIESVPHAPRLQKGVLSKAVADIQKNPLLGLDEAMAKATGPLTDAQVARRYVQLAYHLQNGNEDIANVISKALAPGATETARGLAMFSIINRTSPNGAFHWATKLGADATKAKEFYDRAAQIAKMPEGVDKTLARGELARDIGYLKSNTLGNKVFSVWRAGLLTGARTLTKVATSHVVHAVVETAKDIPASAVDATAGKLLSRIFTGEGKRSLVLTGRGSIKGTVDAAKHIGKYIRTGVDTSGPANQDFHAGVFFGRGIPGRIANAYVNGPGRLHGSIYNTAAGGAHLRSLYSQGLAEAKNLKLSGAAKSKFLEDFVSKPSAAAEKIATQDGEIATMRQKTLMSDLMTRIQNTDSPAFNMIARVLVPFQRIPSAIAIGIIDYSPAGVMKTVIKTIRTARKEEGWTMAAQREFSQGLGRSITGTTGAMIPGIMLYNRGMLTTEYPKDTNEQKLWALEGKKPWSVKIGGKWRSLGSLGPTGLVVAMGGGIAESLKNGNSVFDATVAGMFTGVKALQDASYLSGLNTAIQAVQEGGTKVVSWEKSIAGSIIPTIIANYAATSDKYVRKTNTPSEAIQSKIPGYREHLEPSKNAFGQPIPTPETGIKGLTDPFYSSKVLPTTPLTNELQRLQDAGYGIMPSSTSINQTIGDFKVQLTKSQAQQLQANRNSATTMIWNKLIASPQYQKLQDYQKQAVLRGVESDITNTVKTKFLLDAVKSGSATVLSKYAPKKK